MTQPVYNTFPASDSDAELLARDRRRVDRKDVNPALIPLLRGTAADIDAQPETPPPSEVSEAELEPPIDAADGYATSEAEQPADDNGNPARGILIGLLLVIPFWAILAVIIYENWL